MRVTRCTGCGGKKPQHYLVCRNCWNGLPQELKSNWHQSRGSRPARIAAAQAIFRHVLPPRPTARRRGGAA